MKKDAPPIAEDSELYKIAHSDYPNGASRITHGPTHLYNVVLLIRALAEFITQFKLPGYKLLTPHIISTLEKVGFAHDLGREADGPDTPESEARSAKICYDHLCASGLNSSNSHYFSQLIIDKDEVDLPYRFFHSILASADTFEVMRNRPKFFIIRLELFQILFKRLDIDAIFVLINLVYEHRTTLSEAGALRQVCAIYLDAKMELYPEEYKIFSGTRNQKKKFNDLEKEFYNRRGFRQLLSKQEVLRERALSLQLRIAFWVLTHHPLDKTTDLEKLSKVIEYSLQDAIKHYPYSNGKKSVFKLLQACFQAHPNVYKHIHEKHGGEFCQFINRVLNKKVKNLPKQKDLFKAFSQNAAHHFSLPQHQVSLKQIQDFCIKRIFQRQMKEHFNISDFSAFAGKHFWALLKRLQHFESFSPTMQKQLLLEVKGDATLSVLTSSEQDFLARLPRLNLKHHSKSVSRIKLGQLQPASVHGDRSNTSAALANNHCVFFGLHLDCDSSNRPNYRGHRALIAPLSRIVSRYNTWSGEHHPAYRRSDEPDMDGIAPVQVTPLRVIGKTRYFTVYAKNFKYYFYTQGESHRVRVFPKGHMFQPGEKTEEFVYYTLIEHMRYLDVETRNHYLYKASQQEIRELIHYFFPTKEFELHALHGVDSGDLTDIRFEESPALITLVADINSILEKKLTTDSIGLLSRLIIKHKPQLNMSVQLRGVKMSLIASILFISTDFPELLVGLTQIYAPIYLAYVFKSCYSESRRSINNFLYHCTSCSLNKGRMDLLYHYTNLRELCAPLKNQVLTILRGGSEEALLDSDEKYKKLEKQIKLFPCENILPLHNQRIEHVETPLRYAAIHESGKICHLILSTFPSGKAKKSMKDGVHMEIKLCFLLALIHRNKDTAIYFYKTLCESDLSVVENDIKEFYRSYSIYKLICVKKDEEFASFFSIISLPNSNMTLSKSR